MLPDPKPESEQPMIWLREEPRSRNPRHSRAQIAQAAIEIADDEGFEAVSMRRVAQRLDAGTMTLYHYVANKDEVVALMMDAVMGELIVPADDLAEEWRPAMAAIALRSLEVIRRHRWMVDRLGDGRPGPNAMRHLEQSLEAMSSAGLDGRASFEAIVLVDEYVFGFAIREAQEREERARGGWAPGVTEFFQRELDSGNFPHVRELLGADVDSATKVVADVFFAEGRFERGLERLLDGIEAGFQAEVD